MDSAEDARIDAPAVAEVLVPGRQHSMRRSARLRNTLDEPGPSNDRHSFETIFKQSMSNPLRSTVTEAQQAAREENIFAHHIADDDTGVEPTEFLIVNPFKKCRRFFSSVFANAALAAFVVILILANFIAYTGSGAPVLPGLAIAAVLWVAAQILPLATDREFLQTVRARKAKGTADVDASVQSSKPGGGDHHMRALGEKNPRASVACPSEDSANGGVPLRRNSISVHPEDDVSVSVKHTDAVRSVAMGDGKPHVEVGQSGTGSPSERHIARLAMSVPGRPALLRRGSAHLREWAQDATNTRRSSLRPKRKRGGEQVAEDTTSAGSPARQPTTSAGWVEDAIEALATLQQAFYRVHDSPVYWVIRTGRSIVWSAMYITTTYYLTEREPSTGYWDFSDVPSELDLIMQVSIWTTTLDYLFELQAAGGWAFVLSFGSLTMFVTMPIFSVLLGVEHVDFAVLGFRNSTAAAREVVDVARRFESSQGFAADVRPQYFLLQYGWLRFVELYRVNTLVLAKTGVASVGIQSASLLIGILCILLTMAGSVHSFEAPVQENFASFEHFFYFSLVTVTTVGYGDFSPSLGLSRTACMAGIVMAVTWIPVQLSRLQQALAQQGTMVGIPPDRSEPYVLLCGHMSRLQLQIFFRQVSEHKITTPARFVVLSTTPLNELAIHTMSREEQRRIYFEQIDILRSLALGTSSHKLLLRSATAVFVFNRERVESPFGNASAAMDRRGDQQTTIRVLTLLTFVRPRHMCVQLQSLHNAPMLRTLGIQNLLCLNEIKMRWLAKAVTDCQGIVTLMANLLTTASEVRKESRAENISEHQREYLQGACSEMFCYQLPAWSTGKKAHHLYDVMAHVDGLILLAVKDDDLMYIWRGDFDVIEGMVGVWIARDFEQVRAFCERSQPPPSLLMLATDRGGGKHKGSRTSICITSNMRCNIPSVASISPLKRRTGPPKQVWPKQSPGAGAAGGPGEDSRDGSVGKLNRLTAARMFGSAGRDQWKETQLDAASSRRSEECLHRPRPGSCRETSSVEGGGTRSGPASLVGAGKRISGPGRNRLVHSAGRASCSNICLVSCAGHCSENSCNAACELSESHTASASGGSNCMRSVGTSGAPAAEGAEWNAEGSGHTCRPKRNTLTSPRDLPAIEVPHSWDGACDTPGSDDDVRAIAVPVAESTTRSDCGQQRFRIRSMSLEGKSGKASRSDSFQGNKDWKHYQSRRRSMSVPDAHAPCAKNTAAEPLVPTKRTLGSVDVRLGNCGIRPSTGGKVGVGKIGAVLLPEVEVLGRAPATGSLLADVEVLGGSTATDQKLPTHSSRQRPAPITTHSPPESTPFETPTDDEDAGKFWQASQEGSMPNTRPESPLKRAARSLHKGATTLWIHANQPEVQSLSAFGGPAPRAERTDHIVNPEKQSFPLRAGNVVPPYSPFRRAAARSQWHSAGLKAIVAHSQVPKPPAEVPKARAAYDREKHGVRIVLCGWPRNVEKLLEIALRKPELRVVIFAPVQPDHASRNTLRSYRDKYVFVPGNPLDREELKPLVLKPGLHSVIVFNEYLTEEARADPMDVVVCAANVESMLPPGNRTVQLLVSLNSSSDMRFVDRTSWWPSSEDPLYGHVSSPTYASGSVIADEMLYPLMMGWFKHGLIEFCNKLTDSVLDATEVKLIEMPRQFCTTRQFAYGEMLPPMMAAGYLPIALYRLRVGANAKFMQPYVLTNPPHSTVLRKSDRVYVLMRNTKRRNYTSSVKRLERAARIIQRYFRQRAEEQWAKTYWRLNQLPSPDSISRPAHEQPVAVPTLTITNCAKLSTALKQDDLVMKDYDDNACAEGHVCWKGAVRAEEQGASHDALMGNGHHSTCDRQTCRTSLEVPVSTKSDGRHSNQSSVHGAGGWWFPQSPVPSVIRDDGSGERRESQPAWL